MGKFPRPRRLRLIGWIATGVMGLVLAGLVWTGLGGGSTLIIYQFSAVRC